MGDNAATVRLAADVEDLAELNDRELLLHIARQLDHIAAVLDPLLPLVERFGGGGSMLARFIKGS